MTVYIDVLIVMNIYISYFTLRASARLLHTAIPFGRLAGASVLGGFTSLAALIETGLPAALALRVLLTALMTLTAFGFGSAKLLALRSFVCFAVTMLICGAAVLIHELTGSSIIFPANGYVYVSVSALVLVISSAVIYGALLLLRRIFDSPLTDEPLTLRITNLGNTAELTAIADTGSHLRDFLTGLPVIVCKRSAITSVTPPNVAAYLNGDDSDISGIRLIPAATVTGSALVAAFRPSEIRAGSGNIRLEALVAASDSIPENESFDAVIPAKLLK